MNRVLTEGFSTFLRRRRAKGHFERRPLLESPSAGPAAVLPASPGVTAAGSQDLLAAAQCEPAQALALLRSQADGLEEKFVPYRAPGTAATPGAGALEQRNLVFMGTNVVSGTATALVAATDGRSYFGTLAAHATAVETAPNAFQAGVNSVSWLLIRFAAVMVPIVFFVNGFSKGDWLEAFLFALSVAVGLTPEMLPMIVTSTLAKGAVRLSRKQVVVKRLDAIQNFGAMDILCTDKTGIRLDNVDAELVTQPLKWNPADIGRFMLFFGPISSLFDIITFAVLWWVFDANSVDRQAFFQSGWCVVGLLTTLMKRGYIRRYGWQ